MIYKDFIESSLQEASKIASSYFGKVSGITKEGDNNQVLTQADLEVGKFLVSRIKTQYPTYNIIDEEAGVIDNNSNFTWVVDPIDGTSNFANGVPTYGIMIGLLENDQPIAGGAALPFFNEIYTAESQHGTFCNGQAVSVTRETDLLKTLISYGIDGHQENSQLTYNETKVLAEIVLHCRNLRSSNSIFDIAQIIKGGYGGMLNKTSKIWDNVAPHILVEEAGGIYTDYTGNTIDYKDATKHANKNFTFCTAAPQLHKELQQIIHHATSVQ